MSRYIYGSVQLIVIIYAFVLIFKRYTITPRHNFIIISSNKGLSWAYHMPGHIPGKNWVGISKRRDGMLPQAVETVYKSHKVSGFHSTDQKKKLT